MSAASDRELLELAAKAAGYKVLRVAIAAIDGSDGVLLEGVQAPWNPLADDGDSRRLEVLLGLEVYHTINGGEWTVFVGFPSDGRIKYVSEGYGTDPYAATRRAIVRAAAEIGRAA